MKDTIEGKHVPFQRYVITPEEREEIENDKQLPSYSRAFAQDAPLTSSQLLEVVTSNNDASLILCTVNLYCK